MPVDETPSHSDGLKVINAGLFRMATKSMARAYIILGFKTHHGLLEDVTESPWALIEAAAEATWPNVPGASTRPPHTRADWDKIWGAYDAVTDLASPFALELIKAYPEAKVVIVQRDFDSWWPSFRAQIRDTVMTEPMSSIYAFITSTFLGIRPVHATKKLILGFFNAKTKSEVNEARAREVYDAYFRDIRKLVPEERRLEYKMGSGWKPLCAFLDVEEPDVAFPRENDRALHSVENESRTKKFIVNTMKVTLPWLLGAAMVGAAWMAVREV